LAGTPSEESDGETEVEQPVRPEALLPRRRRTGVLIGVAVALWLVMVAASDDVVQKSCSRRHLWSASFRRALIAPTR
jgi:hypothetical protein